MKNLIRKVTNDLKRPTGMVLIVVASIGWLMVIYMLWNQNDSLAAYEQQLKEAEASRLHLSSELEKRKLEVGHLEELQQRAQGAREALIRLDEQQKKAQVALDRVQNDLTAVQGTLAETTKLRDERGKAAEKLQSQAKDAEQRLALARERHDSIQKTIANRSGELATVGKRLEDARQREARAREQLEVLSGKASARADELAQAETRLQQARSATAVAENNLSFLRGKINEVAQQLSDLNQALADRTKDVSMVKKQLKSAQTRLTAMAAKADDAPTQ